MALTELGTWLISPVSGTIAASMASSGIADASTGSPDRLALGVVRRGRLAEPDRGEVLLVEADQVGQQTCRGVEAQDEQPGRHRVEGARVPHLAGAGELAHA